MGWFTRKITSPEETYAALLQSDEKISGQAAQDFADNFNADFAEFLSKKFVSGSTNKDKLVIIRVFALARAKLDPDCLKHILPLLAAPGNSIRSAFKDVLVCFDENNVRSGIDFLAQTTDGVIHKLIQHGFEESGIIDDIQKRWADYTPAEQIEHLRELTELQSPRLYPILFRILKDNAAVLPKTDLRRLIQVELCKNLSKVTDPSFLDLCISNMAQIAPAARHYVFKSLQIHGEVFYAMFFEELAKQKDEDFILHSLRIISQLNDPLSYRYLFPYLRSQNRSVPPVVSEAIGHILRDFTSSLNSLEPELIAEPEMQKQIKSYAEPLIDELNAGFFHNIKLLTESILRLGRFKRDIILRTFGKLFLCSAEYVKNYMSGLELEARTDLLLNACCSKDMTTARAALSFLNNPSENYLSETLAPLVTDRFAEVADEMQTEVINIIIDPAFKKNIAKVIYEQPPHTKAALLRALGKTGKPSVLKILKCCLNDSDTLVQNTVLELLDEPQFANDSGTELIFEMLKSDDPNFVIRCIKLLEKRSHSKVLSNLTYLMMKTRSREVSECAHAAIAAITERKYLTGFDKMTEESRKTVGCSLIKMNQKFLPETTSRLFDPDQNARVLAAKILNTLGQFLPPDLKYRLSDALKDSFPVVRAIVVTTLGRTEDPVFSEKILPCLSDIDNRVRANAVEALAAVASYAVVEYIIPCLNDANNRVKANTVVTLWKLGYYQVFDTVVAMLRHSDKWMRASAAFAIGELHDQRYCSILLHAVRDSDPDVRRNGVKALSKILEPAFLTVYLRSLRYDPDESVRREVAALIG